MSLDAVACGRREFRYEWLTLVVLPIEGIASTTGVLDGFVRRKANQGVLYKAE